MAWRDLTESWKKARVAPANDGDTDDENDGKEDKAEKHPSPRKMGEPLVNFARDLTMVHLYDLGNFRQGLYF